MSLLYAVQMLGVAVFAASGVLAAGRKDMDVFGMTVIALVTAIGGGTFRDLLLDRTVFWVADEGYLVAAIVAALLTMAWVRFRRPPLRALMVADAIGLGLFTILGARIAEAAGAGPLVIVLLGMLTGVAGGILRDVLSAEIPLIFRKSELYATASIAGVVAYLVISRSALAAGLPLPAEPPVLLGMAVVILLRLLSMFFGLTLPVLRMKDD